MDRPTNLAANAGSTASPAIGATGAIPPGRYLVFLSIAVIGCAGRFGHQSLVLFLAKVAGGRYLLAVAAATSAFSLAAIWELCLASGKEKWGTSPHLASLPRSPFRFGSFGFARRTTLGSLVALGCVMAGVLGNLYDRLGLSGDEWVGPDFASPQGLHAVRDWILWQANDSWRWPNFNIADSLLVVGVGILMLHAVFPASSVPTKQPS